MSSITEAQDEMGEVYKAWLAKSSDEATENQARFVECRDAAIGGGWSPCNFKWAKNEWPSRCGLPINAGNEGRNVPLD